MSDPEISGKPGGANFVSKNKFLIYLVLVICLLVSGVYAVSAVTSQVTGLTISPNPIKLGLTTSISYTLGQDSKVNLTILKESGEVVCSLLTNAPRLTGLNKAYWDGEDSGGSLVPDGRYKIVAESLDDTGTQTGLMEQLVVAARYPSISSVTDAPDPFNPLDGEKSRITYTISSDSNVNLTILKGSAAVVTIPGTEVKPAGTHTIEWDGTNGTAAVADGSYTYQLDAVSPMVSAFKSTFRGTTVVEKEAPQVTGLTIAQNPLKLGVVSQFFKFTLSENAAVTAKVYDSGNNLVRTITNAENKLAGLMTLVWDGKNDAGSYVPEGQYTGVINAVDNYGKSSGDQKISFTAGYQPVVSGAAVVPDPYNPGSGSAAINYNISANALVTVKILSGTTVVASVVQDQAQDAGDHSIAWDGQALADGSYTLQVTAVSPTVAAFNSLVKVPFSIAGSPLRITDLTLTPDPYKIGIGVLSVKYTLSENATVNVRVYQGSTTVRSVAAGEAKPAGTITSVWDGKNGTGSYVPEGIYSVSVSATDPSGNTSEVSGTFTAGYLPVISSVTSPPSFDPAGGPAAISFNLSQDARVSLTIIQGAAVVKSFPAADLKAGANSLSWDGKNAAGQAAADGPYTFQLDAVSPLVSNFKSTYRGTVTLEAADPVLSGLSISPSPVKIGSGAFLRFTISEPATTTATILKADDRSQVVQLPPNVRTIGGSSAISWDTKDSTGSLITTGNYIMALSTVDNFSKTASAELPFSAAAVPVISNVYATPASVDLAKGSQVTFSYNLSERSFVTVKVFDASNIPVKTIYSGKEMPSGPATAVWDCTNTANETVKGTFTFKIDATSVIGSLRALQASGTVEVSGTPVVEPPPAPTACRDCHTTYPETHPVSNCEACHGGNKPIEDCRQCHGGSHDYRALITYECTYCHNETYSYKVPYHEGDINLLHQAPLTQDCQKCHNPALNLEHPLHSNDAGVAYDCNTCHQSTVTEVVYAIGNGLKNCSACHTAGNHDAVHQPTGIETGCTSCHMDSLTQEHLNNPTTQAGNSWTCDTCHASTVPNVVNAIGQGLKNCDACHTVAGHNQFHDTNNLDSNCLTCHNNNLSYEHLENTKTQLDESGSFAPKTCNTCHASTDPIVEGAIATENTQCAACHRTGHNVSFVENVPGYVYKYPGFDWTPPQDALLWTGESWMPPDYEVGGKVITSNRRPASSDGVVDASYGPVFDYYNTKLTADGWSLITPLPAQPDYFQVTYKKGIHQQTIWFYGGMDHTASPVSDSGCRIEVIYK